MARTFSTKQTDAGTNKGRLIRASEERDRKYRQTFPDNPNDNGRRTSIRVTNSATPKQANANKYGTYSSDRVKPQDKASEYTWRDAYVRAAKRRRTK